MNIDRGIDIGALNRFYGFIRPSVFPTKRRPGSVVVRHGSEGTLYKPKRDNQRTRKRFKNKLLKAYLKKHGIEGRVKTHDKNHRSMKVYTRFYKFYY